jgi:hypothetical protein
MLIVESEKSLTKRTRSGKLRDELGQLKKLCEEDDGTKSLKPSTDEPDMTVEEGRDPVKARLNGVALKKLGISVSGEALREPGVEDRFSKLLVFKGGQCRTAAPGASSARRAVSG